MGARIAEAWVAGSSLTSNAMFWYRTELCSLHRLGREYVWDREGWRMSFIVGFRRWLRPDGSGPVDGRSFGRLGGGGRRHEGREVVAEVLGLSATPEAVDEPSARLGSGKSEHAHLLKNVSRKLNPMVTSLCSPSSPPPVFLPCLPVALGATSISTQGGSMSFAC